MWTSLCQFIFLWTSSIVQVLVSFYIWHLFDNLTSFNIFVIYIYVVWEKVIISHLSVSSQGGTYPGWGVPALAREVNINVNINTWQGTYLCLGRYLPLLLEYLHWPLGTFLNRGSGVPTSAGGTHLCLGRVSTLVRGCTFLGDLRKYSSLGGCDGPENIFLLRRVWLAC